MADAGEGLRRHYFLPSFLQGWLVYVDGGENELLIFDTLQTSDDIMGDVTQNR